MNDQISISRELLERIVGKCKLSVLGDDHARVWELLAAPTVDVEGLGVVAWQDAENPAYVTSEIRIMEEWVLDGYPIVPLCSMPKAQALIEQYKEAYEGAESQAEYQRGRAEHFMLERDTLRKQLDEARQLLNLTAEECPQNLWILIDDWLEANK